MTVRREPRSASKESRWSFGEERLSDGFSASVIGLRSPELISLLGGACSTPRAAEVGPCVLDDETQQLVTGSIPFAVELQPSEHIVYITLIPALLREDYAEKLTAVCFRVSQLPEANPRTSLCGSNLDSLCVLILDKVDIPYAGTEVCFDRGSLGW